MASITVSLNFDPLADLKLTTPQLMREVGLLARERIIRRTLSGQSSDGRAFVPYSAGYREQKQKALGSAAVNLQVSGRMLQAITVQNVTTDSVTLGFTD